MKKKKGSQGMRKAFSLIMVAFMLLMTLTPLSAFAADADDIYYFTGSTERGSGQNAFIMNVNGQTDNKGDNYSVFCGDRDTGALNNVPYRMSTLDQIYPAAAADKIRAVFRHSPIAIPNETDLNKISGLNLSKAQWITAAQTAIWNIANGDTFTQADLDAAYDGYQWYLSGDLPGVVSTGITGFPGDFVINTGNLPFDYTFTINVGANCDDLAVTFGGTPIEPIEENGSLYTYKVTITEEDIPTDGNNNIPLVASWKVADTSELMLFVPVAGKGTSQILMGLLQKGESAQANCQIVSTKGLSIKKVVMGGDTNPLFQFKVLINEKPFNGTISISGKLVTVKDGLFEMLGSQTATITDIPEGAVFQVIEIENTNYPETDFMVNTNPVVTGSGLDAGTHTLDSKGNTVTFTNWHNQYFGDIEIKGEKSWSGIPDTQTRPAIEVSLLCGGAIIDVRALPDAETGWSYDFGTHPEYDPITHEKYVYEVKESPVLGFSPVYTGFDILNVKNPDAGELTIGKLVDAAKEREISADKAFEFELSLNKAVTVDPVESDAYKAAKEAYDQALSEFTEEDARAYGDAEGVLSTALQEAAAQADIASGAAIHAAQIEADVQSPGAIVADDVAAQIGKDAYDAVYNPLAEAAQKVFDENEAVIEKKALEEKEAALAAEAGKTGATVDKGVVIDDGQLEILRATPGVTIEKTEVAGIYRLTLKDKTTLTIPGLPAGTKVKLVELTDDADQTNMIINDGESIKGRTAETTIGERAGISIICKNTYTYTPDTPDTPGKPDRPAKPTPDTPGTNIPDPNVPQGDTPATPAVPGNEIPEPDVPRADIPQTGVDGSTPLYLALLGLSLAALTALIITRKKKEQ